jgi:hypothetical protein
MNRLIWLISMMRNITTPGGCASRLAAQQRFVLRELAERARLAPAKIGA